MTDEPCPNNPWFAVTSTFALSTYRPVAWLRSCQASSQTCAIVWAGMASSKQASPPDGLTGALPPIVVAPRRSSCSASSLGHSPRCSYQSRVLDLHRGEVPRRGRRRGPSGAARAARSTPGSSHRSGGSAASRGRSCGLANRGERTLGRGVGADHQSDVVEAGQDVGASALQRLRTAGTRGVAGADRHAIPAQLLRERRPGDETGVAALRMVSAPVTGWIWRQSSPASANAARAATTPYSVKSPAPFAPRVHAGAEDVQRFRTHLTTFHACTMRSTPMRSTPSSVNSGIVVSSISMPTLRSAASVPSDHLAQHDDSLLGQLHRGDRERLERVRRRIRRGRADAGFRCSSTAFRGSTTHGL